MIVVPSRGRFASLQRFFVESEPAEKGLVLLDSDDAQSYHGLIVPDGWQVAIGERLGYVGLMNRAFRLFPDEPWYAYGGDDILCRPVGWDTYLAKAAGYDRIAYGDDQINGASNCCLPFIGGDLVRQVGWLGCPTLKHLYCDTIWHEIGKALGCLYYFPEIITEHCHWSTGKQPFDLTAQERQIQGDQDAYRVFMATQFQEVVARCHP